MFVLSVLLPHCRTAVLAQERTPILGFVSWSAGFDILPVVFLRSKRVSVKTTRGKRFDQSIR